MVTSLGVPRLMICRICLVAIVGALFLALAGESSARQFTCPEPLRLDDARPPRVRFTGIVEKQEHFGPPNYGEWPATDRRVTVLVLRLDHRLQVYGPGFRGTPIISTREIQLHFSSSLVDQAWRLVGKRVLVTGHLELATAPGDYTEVVVPVDEVEAVAVTTTNVCY